MCGETLSELRRQLAHWWRQAYGFSRISAVKSGKWMRRRRCWVHRFWLEIAEEMNEDECSCGRDWRISVVAMTKPFRHCETISGGECLSKWWTLMAKGEAARGQVARNQGTHTIYICLLRYLLPSVCGLKYFCMCLCVLGISSCCRCF